MWTVVEFEAAEQYTNVRTDFVCRNQHGKEGAWIILDVDGKSRLGRFLLKGSEQLERASISKDFKKPKRGLLLQIHDMDSRQEMAIDEAEKALEVIRQRLRIDGFIETYLD